MVIRKWKGFAIRILKEIEIENILRGFGIQGAKAITATSVSGYRAGLRTAIFQTSQGDHPDPQGGPVGK